MKVAEHLVGLPAAEQPNPVRIHVGAQKSHSASGSEGPSGNVLGAKTILWTKDGDGEAKEVGQIGRVDAAKRVCCRIDVRSQWLSRRCGHAAEVEYATRRGENWAELLVSTAPQTDNFPADAAFLCCKFQGDKSCCEEVRFVGSGCREREASQEKADVA